MFASLLDTLRESGVRHGIDGEAFLRFLEMADPHGHAWMQELGIENLTHDAILDPSRLPDIEMCLDIPDWGAASVKQGLSDFGDAIARCGRDVVLDRAEYDKFGAVSVSYHTPGIRRSIREGDTITAGVAFTGHMDTGSWAISPRHYRVRCRNGAISEQDLTQQPNAANRELDSVPAEDVASLVETALSGEKAAAPLERLAQAARIDVADALVGLAAAKVEVPVAHATTVNANFEAAGDRTLYGAFNALTKTARDAPTTQERIDLERQAGVLLGVSGPEPHVAASRRAQCRVSV